MFNDHYNQRYIKFIQSRPNHTHIKYEGYEYHHIFPKSLFPELENEPSNIILLTGREHYLAHWMLAKIYGGKMWFAFNQMRRVIQKENKTSRLYEYAKKYIATEISKSNTGRKCPEHMKKLMSERTKNTVVVKDNNGKLYELTHD